MCPSGKPATPIEKLSMSLMNRTSSYGILEAAFGFLKIADASRRVAPQREDIGDAERLRLRQHAGRVLARRIDARHVRHRGESLLALDAVDDRQRLFAGAAAGAVGDGTEIGLQLPERRNRLFEQRPLAFRRFRRKKLERNHRPHARAPRQRYRVSTACADILSQ